VGTGRGGTKLHASVAGSRITAFLATAAPWEPYFTDNPRTYVPVNLVKFGNGVYHIGVRIYNGLPNKLKIISNSPNKFKASLKEFLHLNSYHTLKEFFKR
jgi:hypothetical protein